MAKLSFLQPQKKMLTNPAAYISLVITGAASFIAHQPIYHEEASNVLQLLSQELRTIFLKFANQRTKGLSWDLAQWKTESQPLNPFSNLLQLTRHYVKNFLYDSSYN